MNDPDSNSVVAGQPNGSESRPEPDLLPLRAAREAMGLSVEEVATELNLGRETIEALEAGEFSRLPPPTFVRGYLRGYARLLRIDTEQLLRLYEDSRPSEPEISRVSQVIRQPGSGHPMMRWVTTLIVIGLIVMAALWWHREYSDDELPVQTSEAPRSVQPGAALDPLPSSAPILRKPTGIIRATEEPENQIERPLPGPTGEASVPAGPAAENDSRVDEVASVTPPPIGQSEDTDGEIAVATAPAGTVADRISASVDSEAAPLATAAPRAEASETDARAASDRLQVSTSAESWLEVRDAEDRQLYFDLLRSGAPASLSGQAPFRVFLGNAPAVSLSLNGETIDQSRFVRSNNTARFVVDRDGPRRR